MSMLLNEKELAREVDLSNKTFHALREVDWELAVKCLRKAIYVGIVNAVRDKSQILSFRGLFSFGQFGELSTVRVSSGLNKFMKGKRKTAPFISIPEEIKDVFKSEYNKKTKGKKLNEYMASMAPRIILAEIVSLVQSENLGIRLRGAVTFQPKLIEAHTVHSGGKEIQVEEHLRFNVVISRSAKESAYV